MHFTGHEGSNNKDKHSRFGDASKKAYCAAMYLVVETMEGISSRLLCSKTRIAPFERSFNSQIRADGSQNPNYFNANWCKCLEQAN